MSNSMAISINHNSLGVEYGAKTIKCILYLVKLLLMTLAIKLTVHRRPTNNIGHAL